MFCKLWKWAINRRLNLRQGPGLMAIRHLSGCEDCRRWLRQTRVMTRELLSQGEQLDTQLPENLSKRIIRRCSESSVKNTSPQRAHVLPRWSLPAAAGIAAVIIAGLVISGVFEKPEQKKTITVTPPPPPPTSLAITMPSPTLPLDIARMADALIIQKYEEQQRLLVRDTKAMAGFFISCLPMEIDATEND